MRLAAGDGGTMTTLRDRAHHNRPPAGQELHEQVAKALGEAKRLRRQIRRLLASARVVGGAGKRHSHSW